LSDHSDAAIGVSTAVAAIWLGSTNQTHTIRVLVTPRIAWHAKSYSASMASVRLRLLEPLAWLRSRGVDVQIYDDAVGPAGYDVIVFCKSYTRRALEIARAARALRKCVIFDICDNLFEKGARFGAGSKLARVQEMLSLATHVTVSTDALARQLQALIPELAEKSSVIPDVLDHHPIGELQEPSANTLRELENLRRFLATHPSALHCVWFGKSTGNLSGLAALQEAVREMEVFALTHPVTLTVISNKRWRYQLASLHWGLPSYFMPWSLETFHEALALHSVAVVPVLRNGFTAGKTINRVATAVESGLGVVADSIESYEEMRPFVVLDDWQAGLRRYLEHPPARDLRLAEARRHLRSRYGSETVGQRWQQVLFSCAGFAAS
jgi:hypothetical protein